MKKYIYCALIALITLACNKDEEPSFDKTSQVAPDKFYAQTPIFKSRALTEVQPESWDESETVDSRTYAVVDPEISNEYFQYWERNDAISVFFTTQNLKYSLMNYDEANPQDVGIFQLDDDKTTSGSNFSTGYYYSVYPYRENTSINKRGNITYTFPETQHYNQHLSVSLEGDSYSNGENAMAAIEPIETDNTLYFKNFCSYLQLQLVDKDKSCTGKKVKSIKLVANNPADKLTGTGLVYFVENQNKEENNTHTPVVNMNVATDATNRITLDCGNGITLSQDENNPSKFWFVLPGEFTFTQGFVVTVIFDDETYFRKVTIKPLSIERSHIKPMVPVDPDPFVPKGPIIYKYNNAEDYLKDDNPFPVKNTFYGEDGLQLEVVGQRYIEEYNEWMILLSGTLKAIGGNSFSENNWPLDIEYVKVDNKMEFGRGSDEEGSEENVKVASVSIKNNAFNKCSAELVEIFNDVDSVDYSAFESSTITDLIIHGDVTTFKTNAGAGSIIKNIQVDGNVQTIDYNAFNNCDYLETINIPNGYDNGSNTIGSLAFNDCDNLKEVNYPMVSKIETGAFDGCNKLVTVHINKAKTIGAQAFNGCNSLATVTITQVEKIEAEAFNVCSTLSTINLKSVKEIGNKAFYSCYSLENVDFTSIIKIGWDAFNATKLKTITIPSSCTEIGEGAFNECKSLQTVYCYAIEPPYIDSDNGTDAEPHSYAFGQVRSELTIYVPDNTKSDYTDAIYFWPDKDKNWWKNYETIIFEMSQGN